MLILWFLLLIPTLALSNSLRYLNQTSFNTTSFPNITSGFGFTNLNTSNDFQYKGVALGGWLLLEPWITPLLFKATIPSSGDTSGMAIDEYTYCQIIGAEEAQRRLEEHWGTFYNESDFKDMRAYGFNMVRIPIGYWAFEKLPDDPYVSGAQKYLDKAIEWSYNNGLKVWIDLHGAPGSQNGFDNSGRFLNYTPGWQNTTENLELTISVLRKIYSKYGSKDFYTKYEDTILGIEVLNEPMGPKLDMNELIEFYESSYLDARVYSDTNNTIVFHDAFMPAGYWDTFLNESSTQEGRLKNYNILIDHHHYEIFTIKELNQTISQHLKSLSNYAAGINAELSSHPAVVGEWSGALTDCTPYLNGVHFGSRWDGTFPYINEPIINNQIGRCEDINDWSKWSKEHKRYTRKFIEMQLDRYESKINGWIFWTYKTEESIEWDFKRLAKYGLFPQPFSKREYIRAGADQKPENGSNASTRPNVIWLFLAAVFIYLY